MFEQLDCISLRTVKYNDRHSILSVYTRQHGRLAMLLPAGATREAKRLKAICQPMNRFSCVADFRPSRDIQTMRDVKSYATTSHASMSPVKSALALFIADFLASTLREPQQDVNLFDFLTLTIATLSDTPMARTANFHIAFLVHLQHFLGIEPDWSTYSPGAVFDLNDGIFRTAPPLHNRFLPSVEAQAAFNLRRMNFRTSGLFRMSRFDRNRILDRIIQYYSIHYPSIGTLSSLEVLHTLFDF